MYTKRKDSGDLAYFNGTIYKLTQDGTSIVTYRYMSWLRSLCEGAQRAQVYVPLAMAHYAPAVTLQLEHTIPYS